MARFIYQGTVRDGAGNVISSATIAVFLAGTSTAAAIYSASSGGVSSSSTTSSSAGAYSFWVDNDDYDADQLFKVTISKTGYSSTTWDNVVIFPYMRDVSA